MGTPKGFVGVVFESLIGIPIFGFTRTLSFVEKAFFFTAHPPDLLSYPRQVIFGGSHGSSRNMFINDAINKILEFDIIDVDRIVPNTCIIQEFKSEGWSFVLNFLPICLGPQWVCLGACLFICALLSLSTMTISWSDRPGMVWEAFTKLGLLVKNKSRRRSSLVGSLCIWLRSKSWLRPNNHSLISLSEEFGYGTSGKLFSVIFCKLQTSNCRCVCRYLPLNWDTTRCVD